MRLQFHSIAFLFFFLPLFLAAYYIFPRRWRSAILLAGSLFFYAMCSNGNLWWLGIAAGLTCLTYWAGIHIAGKKWLLTLCLSFMVCLLAFFKLYHGGSLQPAGMSFYLFQMAAYLIDAFRGKMKPESSIIAYGAKSMMFPKLLSGPLMQPVELAKQEAEWDHPASELQRGLEQLILGLSIKVLVADRLGGLWANASVVGYDSISVAFAWIALVSYALRLYLDFWGYSLMAMGLGRMLGFHIPRNFHDPYTSKTVSEFFRRWHITLGLWFRDYLYIPLGGSRKGMLRTIFNLLVVWLATGLWHGTGSSYLIWAAILAFFIINEKLWLGKLMNRSRVFSHVYLVLVILLSWVPFAAGSYEQMILFFGRLFGVMGKALNGADFLIRTKGYELPLLAGLLLATPLPEKLWMKIRGSRLSDCIIFVLFWMSIYAIATAEQSPFMYFQY